MRGTISLRSMLVLIVIGHAAACYFFLNGFMLTRLQLPDTSSCKDYNASSSSSSQCWSAPQVDKVVILLVDALRYDFVVSAGSSSQSLDLHGHMPGLSELVDAYGNKVSMVMRAFL